MSGTGHSQSTEDDHVVSAFIIDMPDDFGRRMTFRKDGQSAWKHHGQGDACDWRGAPHPKSD